MLLESDFPTVIYSKLSFSSLILTNGNLPIPLILSTLVNDLSPSWKFNTAEAMMTFASSGVKYILNSFLAPGLKWAIQNQSIFQIILVTYHLEAQF